MREYIFEATKQEVLDSVLGSVNFMGFPAYRDGKLTKDAERIFDVTCRTQMGDFLLEGIASDAQAPPRQGAWIGQDDHESLEGYPKLAIVPQGQVSRSM